MQFGGHGNRHRVDAAHHLAIVERSGRPIGRRDLARARLVRVDDGDELDAGKGRENPGVMTPEMADADNGDAKRRHAVRPTIAMPAASAARTMASPSIISVFPASTDNAVAPAAFIASIVDTPTTGTSNRMS